MKSCRLWLLFYATIFQYISRGFHPGCPCDPTAWTAAHSALHPREGEQGDVGFKWRRDGVVELRVAAVIEYRQMGFLFRTAAVVSGGCAAAGAYVFSNRLNSKQFAQDVPAGASLAFRFQPRIEAGKR